MNIDLFKNESYLGLIVIKLPIEKTLDCLSQLGWFDLVGWTIKSEIIDVNTHILNLLDLSVSTYYSPEINIIWEPQNVQGITMLRTTSEDCHSSLFTRLANMNLECFIIRICNYKGRAAYTFGRRNGDRRSVRYVQYIQDGLRSEFFMSGNPLPFENEDYYSRRLKKDRINAVIILEYMNALGWNMLDDSFWLSHKQAYYEVREFTGVQQKWAERE